MIDRQLGGGHILRRVVLACGIALVGLCTQSPAGAAAELALLSANVFTGVLDDIVRSFEGSTGHKVILSYATAGTIRDRIRSGEPGDVAILTRPMLDQLEGEGRIASGTSKTFARSHVAVVVRAGAPRPEIGSVDSFRRALVGARSVSYPDPNRGGATGVLFTAVIARLNIEDELKEKTIFPPAGHFAVELVATGKAQLAIAQPMEALRQTGVEIVGPLPTPLQDPQSFTFGAGRMSVTGEPQLAHSLIEYLRGATARAVLAKAGMDAESPGE
jgi:molybdate transport system substrate-binding protein